MTVTHRVVLTACVAVLAVVVVVLIVLALDRGEWSWGLPGMAMLVTSGAVLATDAWSGRRRPAPRLEDGGVVLQTSRVVGVVLVLAAVGFAVVMLSFVLDGDVLGALAARRGVLLPVGMVLAPVLLVGAVAMAARPDRVVLRPGGVEVRRGTRTRTVAWDGLDAAASVESVRIRAGDSRPIRVFAGQLGMGADDLMVVLRHYATTPAHRAELATDAALRRVAQVHRAPG